MLVYKSIKKLINILAMFLYSSCIANANILFQNNSSYIFTYKSYNPSLGKVSGTKIFTVFIQKNKVNAVNLATGEIVEQKNIPYIDVLLESINKEPNSYHVEYDKNHFPHKISSSKNSSMLGNSLIIKILEYNIVKDDYVLDRQVLRIAYFKKNYQKWLSFKKNTYTFSYQDIHLKNIYLDGVEVTIKDNEIISLRDIYTYKFIDIVGKDKILTIEKIFNLIERSLYENKNGKLKVFYNEEYGYPYYIMNQESKGKKIEIFLHNLKIKMKG